MQGSLSEIDIRSILQLIELGQRTGELMVEAYTPSPNGTTAPDYSQRFRGPCWLLFCLNGQIIYAGQSENSLSRLRDYLHRYHLETVLDQLEVPALATVNALEYGYLWVLLEKNMITPAQGRSIIHSMIQETLFDLLSQHQGGFIFELGPPLTPQLTTLEISSLLAKIMRQVQEWKTFHPYIQSPNHCPSIPDRDRLRKTVKPSAFETLSQWADGETSFRQIARYLNRDVVTVTRAIYPFVQQGLVHILTPDLAPDIPIQSKRQSKLSSSVAVKTPRILCIDDDSVVREIVETTLHQRGYEIKTVGHPLEAITVAFQFKPDLILCDIVMPDLNGYEICAMLRSSTAFRQTPIVMLTGIDGFIDRLKARMVHASNYLTKPFGEHELLTLVEATWVPGNLALSRLIR
ncbi:MAG: response regulator [Oscillatoriales cyanobacterium RM2_1_1]|nr:response regulator [Oscillatoriales cyanobacterium SM2_3_0]NJO45218.1 response regulator [Oscillatoriales cyanobacterium RM2_1_1]